MANNKTVAVTGGAGFIGSTFLNYMVPLYPYYTFVNLDALTYAGNLENIEVHESNNYIFKKGDIRDSNFLKTIFNTYHPDYIVHIAAETHVDVSIENPSIFVETNIVGTHNLLRIAREHQVSRFLHVSTDEVYGSLALDDHPSQEDNPLQPNSPYSASKASSDMLGRAYFKTFNLPVLISRCSNNYGPRQHFEKFIPTAITKLLNGEKIPVYGNGKNIRDWIYVEDHVRALDTILPSGTIGEIYNIGGSCELTNNDIAQKLMEISGTPSDSIAYVMDRPGHDFRYALDSSKTQSLGWSPVTDLETGLARTFEYYKSR